jgi:hypothetical protein
MFLLMPTNTDQMVFVVPNRAQLVAAMKLRPCMSMLLARHKKQLSMISQVAGFCLQ